MENQICPVCKRHHSESQPCPRRLAMAMLSATKANMDALSASDKEWLSANRGFNLEELLEEELACRLP